MRRFAAFGRVAVAAELHLQNLQRRAEVGQEQEIKDLVSLLLGIGWQPVRCGDRTMWLVAQAEFYRKFQHGEVAEATGDKVWAHDLPIVKYKIEKGGHLSMDTIYAQTRPWKYKAART